MAAFVGNNTTNNKTAKNGLAETSSSASIDGVWLAVVAAVAFLTGVQVLSFGFAFDDFWTILDNAYLSRPDGLGGLLDGTAAAADVPDAGRPLMVALHWIERRLFGWRSPGYHLVSLLWHVGCAVMVYLVSLRLVRRNQTAVLSGLFFAVHPIHAEVVAVVSFREDSMACALSLMAWFFCLEAVRRKRKTARCLLAMGGAVSLFLAIASKESAAIAPLVFFLGHALATRVSFRKEWKKNWLQYVSLAAAVGAALLFRVYLFGTLNPYGGPLYPHVEDLWQAPWTTRVATALQMTALGFGQMLSFGWGQAPEYCPQAVGWLDFWAFFGLVVCAGLIGVIVWARKVVAPLAAGLAFMVVAFVPTSNLFWMPNLRGDRFWYWPSVGFCLALAALVSWIFDSRPQRKPKTNRIAFGVVSAAIIAAWTVAFVGCLQSYRNDDVLWTVAVRKAPCNHRAQVGAGMVDLKAGRLEKSLARAQTALSLRGGYPPAHYLRGRALLAQKRFVRAQRSFHTALRRRYWRPALVWLSIARAAAAQNDRKAARSALQRALTLEPGLWQGWALKTLWASRRQDHAAAARCLLETIAQRLWPSAGWSRRKNK